MTAAQKTVTAAQKTVTAAQKTVTAAQTAATGEGPLPGRLGATPLDGGRTAFLVWAPAAARVEVRCGAHLAPLEALERGYHGGVVEGVGPGDLYLYRLDGRLERPDPASSHQPQGVHGPSQVVGRDFPWTAGAWPGVAQRDLVFYELHVGTFTPEGTFDAAAGHLGALADLGVTAVELMPVAQFPGRRNWGYDGVFPYAAQSTYGGPDGLRRLVDACHGHGLALFLDVVYNHLGPEGNRLGDFGPYFTDRYRTPWGPAPNLDGPGSDEVRRFWVENACRWITEFRVDGLRLDAVHAIVDQSAVHLLEELGEAAHGLERRACVIAESDLNAPRLIRPRSAGGFGLDGQWSDDFHHALHALLTGERQGYYGDFGRVEDLARALRSGYAYSGQRSAFRGRRHGAPPWGCVPESFVVCAQNHDQVGNRAAGDRLAASLPPAALRLAAAAVVLSPFLPLLFMGEEYGETAPFQYFTDHGDPALVEAVRAGRRREFEAFAWRGEVPDPQDEATFARSRLRRVELPGLRDFYRRLLLARRRLPALADPAFDRTEATADEARRVLLLRRWNGDQEALCLFAFRDDGCEAVLPVPAGSWHKELDGAGPDGPLPDPLVSTGEARLTVPPWACAVYTRRRGVEA